MNDPTSSAALAVARHGATAPLLVFLAGVLSCFGPCVAPRFLAVTSVAGADARRMRTAVFLFISGLVAAYALLGGVTSLLGHVLDLSRWMYTAAAVLMIAAGIWSVVHAHPGDAAPRAGTAPLSFGGVFLLGASFAFIAAPCCTPLVVAIVAYTSAQGDPLYGASLLAIFALGHSVPIALAGMGAGSLAHVIRRAALHQATAITSGSLLAILGGFYACIA